MRLMRSWFERWVSSTLGDRGERAAARFLRKAGFTIVTRNYRTAHGEVDLIALDGETVVFVEVKTRSSMAAGSPFDAVDERKQKQLTKLALEFLKKHDLLDVPARFDVVGIVWADDKSEPQITHVVNAFAPDGSGQMFA